MFSDLELETKDSAWIVKIGSIVYYFASEKTAIINSSEAYHLVLQTVQNTLVYCLVFSPHMETINNIKLYFSLNLVRILYQILRQTQNVENE